MLKLDFCQTLLMGVYFGNPMRARLDSFVGRIWPASHQLMTGAVALKDSEDTERKNMKKKKIYIYTGVYIQSEQDRK